MTEFIERRNGYNVYSFDCPICGTTGEIGVPARSVKLIPHECGQLFMQRNRPGIFAHPILIEVNSRRTHGQ